MRPNHKGKAYQIVKDKKEKISVILSAIGSKILPSSLISFLFLAIRPSKKSVSAAKTQSPITPCKFFREKNTKINGDESNRLKDNMLAMVIKYFPLFLIALIHIFIHLDKLLSAQPGPVNIYTKLPTRST